MAGKSSGEVCLKSESPAAGEATGRIWDRAMNENHGSTTRQINALADRIVRLLKRRELEAQRIVRLKYRRRIRKAAACVSRCSRPSGSIPTTASPHYWCYWPSVTLPTTTAPPSLPSIPCARKRVSRNERLRERYGNYKPAVNCESKNAAARCTATSTPC